MNHMGLDLSCTGTGIVVLDDEGVVLATAKDGWALDRKTTTVLDYIDRLLHITTTILDLVRAHGGAAGLAVGIERYAYNARGSQNDLGELGGVVKTQLWLAEHVLPQIVAVNSARALVFGNGRIKKKLVEPALASKGFAFGDSDIADAYVIAEAIRLKARRNIHDNGSGGEDGTGGEGGSEGGRARHPRKAGGGGGVVRRGRARRGPAPGAGPA
jgi:hypothetical protein